MNREAGRVITGFDFATIPGRAVEWFAWVKGKEEGAVGRGTTESEAIEDLERQLDRQRHARRLR